MTPDIRAAAVVGVLAIAPAVATLVMALPACAKPWESRVSNQGTVDAIGLAEAKDGTPTAKFDGLVLLSVSCTDDDKRPLKAPSVSFLAYSQADKRPLGSMRRWPCPCRSSQEKWPPRSA